MFLLRRSYLLLSMASNAAAGRGWRMVVSGTVMLLVRMLPKPAMESSSGIFTHYRENIAAPMAIDR